MVDAILQGNVEEVVVAHKDRLCRFAFDFLEWICKRGDTNLVVQEQILRSTEQELTENLAAIVHVFSCKLYGSHDGTKSKKAKDTTPMRSRRVRIKTTPEQARILRFWMKTHRQTYNEALRLVKDKKAKVNLCLKKLVVTRRESDKRVQV